MSCLTWQERQWEAPGTGPGGGSGPRKFILQLIFTHLFNLSPRPFVKLLCSGLGRRKRALSRGPWRGCP